MKTIDVIFAFKSRKAAKASSVSTDGVRLFSYRTCIAQWYDDNNLIVNYTHYSPTTCKHQTYLKNAFEKCSDINILPVVGNIYRGEQDLKKFLDAQQREFLMII